MRELTFVGFLAKYVRQLSYTDTNSIFKLAQEASEQNLRLREPLYLYAVFSGKTDVLKRASRKFRFDHHYGSELFEYDSQVLKERLTEKGALPIEYEKVWNSYLSQKNRLQTENHTKALIRQKILQLQAQKHLSNYRLYTDLKLTPGNLNKWLKHGNSELVSLDTARRVLRYCQEV